MIQSFLNNQYLAKIRFLIELCGEKVCVIFILRQALT